MKKLARFLIIIPALLCSTLFFVLGSSKDIKAVSEVQSITGDLGTYSSSSYNNALISSYYTDIFSSIDIKLDHTIFSGTYIQQASGGSSTYYDIKFGSYTSTNQNFNRILTFSCAQTIIYQGDIDYVQVYTTTGFQNAYVGDDDYSALLCRRYSGASSMSYLDNTNYTYYGSSMSTAYRNVSIIGTTTFINSMSNAWGNNSNYYYMGVQAGLGSSSTIPDYYFSPNTSSQAIWLNSSRTGSSSTSARTTTKVAHTITSYSCPSTSTWSYQVFWGGLSSNSSVVTLPLSLSGSTCVLSSNQTFSNTFHFNFSDILPENLDFVVNGLTQNTLFYLSDDNSLNEYSLGNVVVDYGSSYFDKTLKLNAYIKLNFKLPFNWSFNGLIFKNYIRSENSTFGVGSINWLENDILSEVSWLSLNGNRSTLYNWLLIFDDYRFPSSSYIEFAYQLSGNTSVVNAPINKDRFAFNFNFVYLNDDDISHFSTIYGVTYRNCKVFDILCWLQNGFTYIIYEMPVVSPIINFVKSGISTITSFNSFIGNFTAWSGFIALISVPITWLVIKKMIGGDK